MCIRDSLNAEDSKVIEYLKIFSPRSREEIEDLARKTEEEPWRRAAQHCLADDLTDLVHGVEQRKAAEAAAQAIFGRGELRDLDERTVLSLSDELGAAHHEGGEYPTVVDAMVAAGVVDTKSAGRRAVAEGGAYLNNVKVADPDQRLTDGDFLCGRVALVRRGKKTVGALTR